MKLKRLWYLPKGIVTTPHYLFNAYTERSLERHGITRKMAYPKPFWIYQVNFTDDACFSTSSDTLIQYLGRKKWRIINE